MEKRKIEEIIDDIEETMGSLAGGLQDLDLLCTELKKAAAPKKKTKPPELTLVTCAEIDCSRI